MTATAYAAIVSLIHLLEDIQLLHTFGSISLEKQLREIESLKEKSCSIQDHLERYSFGDLKKRIVNSSYEAEDIIESYFVDRMLPFPNKYFHNKTIYTRHEKMSSGQVSVVLQKVIHEMDFIKKEMMEIECQQQPNHDPTPDNSSKPYPVMSGRDTMVGVDVPWNQIMNKLTGELSSLQIIPITGMGGIGKTTLAQNIYDNPLFVKYFDVRTWVTISQVYNIQEILAVLLHETAGTSDYHHLPLHLRPCFLYMGVYPEDFNIGVSKLIKLWVAERFIRPNKLKTLEEVAKEYLKDLTERHLIMVDEWGSLGTIKRCRVHDLLRDLCLRQAQKENFISVIKMHKLQDSMETINGQHRIVIQLERSDENIYHPLPHALQTTSMVRSLTYDYPSRLSNLPHSKLLRVLNVLQHFDDFGGVGINLFNLRYLKLTLRESSKFLSTVHRLWNLQTLFLDEHNSGNPNHTINIWKMPHIRHLKGRNIFLPDPLNGQKSGVLGNLQTLMTVVDFSCTDEVIKRIPNVKKLGIKYRLLGKDDENMGSSFCFAYLARLQKLESLIWQFTSYMDFERDFIPNFVLPHSLIKLELEGCYGYNLEDIISTIGVLPHLEKLKLKGFYTGEEWNTFDGMFLHLKFLQISNFIGLVYWTAESAHFPQLECLHIRNMI